MHRVSGQGDVESTFENHRFSKVESFLGITVLPKLCIDCREIANEEGHTSTVRVSVVIPRKLQPPSDLIPIRWRLIPYFATLVAPSSLMSSVCNLGATFPIPMG